MGCCQSEDKKNQTPGIVSTAVHWNVALCGTACSGKKTIFNQLCFKETDFECAALNFESTIVIPIFWGIVQLCKIIMTTKDPYFETFQRKVNKIIITGNPLVDPANATYKYIPTDDNDDDEDEDVINAYIVVINFWYDHFDIDGSFDNPAPRSIENLENLKIHNGSIYHYEIEDISRDMFEYFKILWNCQQMQYAYKYYRHLLPFLENLSYFINRMDSVVELIFKNGDDTADFEAFTLNNKDRTMMYIPDRWKEMKIDNPLTNKPISNIKLSSNVNSNSDINDISVVNSRLLVDQRYKLEKAQWYAPKSTLMVVGGKCKNRDRWIGAFRGCQTLVYVAALDEYCKQSYVIYIVCLFSLFTCHM